MAVTFGRLGTVRLNRGVNVVATPEFKIIPPSGGGGGGGGGGGVPGTQGPNNPGSARDAGFGDDPWDNVTNVFTSNNQYATCTFSAPGFFSNFIQAYNFGFSIPIGATIDGVECTVEASSTSDGDGFNIFNLWKGLYNNGTSYGTIDNAAIQLTAFDAVYTIGGPTNKWAAGGINWDGQSITYADVNNSEFGLVFGNETHGGTLSIDRITMKIYYTV